MCRCCSSDTLIFQKNCNSVQLCLRSNVYYIKVYKNSSSRCTCNITHASDLTFFWVGPLKMIIQPEATFWSCRNTAVLLWERWAAQLEFMLACWWNVFTAEVSQILYKERWREKPKPLSLPFICFQFVANIQRFTFIWIWTLLRILSNFIRHGDIQTSNSKVACGCLTDYIYENIKLLAPFSCVIISVLSHSTSL